VLNDSHSAKRRKTRRDKGEWVPAFLAALKGHGIVRLACQQAQVERRNVYAYRDKNEDFAKLWEEAIEEATDTLVAIARQRAMQGSDRLLEFLLRSHRPEVYRERFDVAQKVNHDFVVDITEAISFASGGRDETAG
jgi:hypothetical protein